MKTFLSLFSLGVAIVGLMQAPAAAQYAAQGYPAYMQGGEAAARQFQTKVPVAWPGNIWIEGNLADRGLGYNGSYMSVGGKSRLFEDFLGGRWVSQVQGNMSLDNGGFFSNIGLERVFTVEAAKSDVFFGVWWDYDDDQQSSFGHTYNQIGVSGGIKSELFDVYANGYLPSGTTSYTQGDITGSSVFLNNSIVTQAGIDTALEGFDFHVVNRPKQLAFMNTYVDVGGYAYGSDVVDTFAGFSLGGGIQTLRGVGVGLQVNHDSRFDWTGALQVAWQFGGRGAQTEYSPLGRDLEPTRRNDHIVRYQRAVILAIDPDTGDDYVVFHVDNEAGPGGDGSFERPFQTLAEAEAASGNHNIIYVHQGDGTTTGMDQGIALKDGQLLLGDGIVHAIPELRLGTFDVFNTVNGLAPQITNIAGDGITLANGNTVRNFDINAAGTNLVSGIHGEGTALNPLEDGIIEQVTIRGNPILNGINLNFITGDWDIRRNDISTAGVHGVGIDNVSGSESVLRFFNNTITTSTSDGIHIEDFEGERFVFRGNVLSNNIDDGLEMLRYTGPDAEFWINNHVSDGNVGAGVHLEDVNGEVLINDSTFNDNSTAGIALVDVNNTQGVNATTIDNVTMTANGTGLSNELNAGYQQLDVTGSTIDGNGLGLLAKADGVGTVLEFNASDNISISNNQSDAIRGVVDDGATLRFILENDPTAPLIMDGNAFSSGLGISMFAQGDGVTSTLNAIIRGVDITNNGDGIPGGIFISAIENSVSQVFIEDVNITGTANSVRSLYDTNNNLINTLVVNRTTAGSFNNSVAGSTRLDLVGTDLLANGSTLEGLFSLDASDATLTRLFLVDSEFSNNTAGDGVRVSGTGAAQILATVIGVRADNNGRQAVAAGESSDTLTPFFETGVNPDPDDDDFSGPFDGWHGFNFNTAGAAHIGLTLSDSDAHGNFEHGLAMYTLGGTIDTVITNNRFTLNDVGDDDDDNFGIAPPETNSEDVAITNFGGQICAALSTNFFSTTNSAVLSNTLGPANFVVELDGVSNQLAPTLLGTSAAPYGTVCQPNIDLLGTVFTGAGFP
jgi:hypothetical protein